MARVSFAKLGLKLNQQVVNVHHNEHTIEVIQYLPIDKKLELIERVINLTMAADENSFCNPVKLEMYLAIEIVDQYTNIDFTVKQKESPQKLYDSLMSNDLYHKIYTAIPRNELNSLISNVREVIDEIYKYQNSVYGILDNISKDYNNLNLDATNIQKSLSDPENLALLKSVLTKLG